MSHYRAAAEGGGGGERTRLLFTGLHPSVESSHLSSHIAQCPSSSSSSSISVTDVKVVKRRDGTSRCIAFAGFRSSRDAERVLEWSNQTWVSGARGGSRVKVDWAKDTREAGSEPVAKRKKFDHAASTSQQQQQDSTKRGGDTSDSRFKEFLSVMAPPKPSAVHDTTTIEDSQIRSTGDSSSAGGGGGEDDDAATSKQDEKRKSSSNGHERDALGLDSTAGTTTTTREDDHVAEDETLTDAEYLAKRMKRTFDQVEAEPADDDDQVENGKAFEQDDEDRPGHENVDENDAGGQDGRAEGASPSRDLTIESILETGRLFVRNLAFSATQQDLETLFSRYGRLEQVHIPVDKATGQPKGLAYVQFEAPWTESSVEAYRALDGTTFQGRLLHILPAVGRAQRPEQDRRDGGGNALKRERLDARKETGGKAFSWATLYLNSNAALSAVADRLGVSKAELLDPTSSSDPAIKVALAEAHTIGEIKQYFENEGVNIEAFGQPGPKSSTCILIKNLPYATSAGSLQLLVSPFTGEQGPRRLLVPPSGTIAIVDFHDANVARDAWRGLLYKQFGGSVLYLEKAPSSIWDAGSASQHDKNETTGIAPVVKATGRDDGGGGGEAATTTKGATLFVKNLNFVTTTERLVASFGHLEGYQFARVQTKPDPKTPGKSLSMGYGFVGFRDVESATRALDVLNRQVLDGHELDVKFAQRGSTSADNDEQRRGGGKTKAGAKAPNETTTKMLVKNVPFEATRKELRQLFSAYGQLKSVRLPRKMDNTTRGFAFLDFATRRDAESAFGALEHAHLLGRHLVLQWAGEGDDDVEEARGKRQGEFDTARKNLTHKKSKFTLETE